MKKLISCLLAVGMALSLSLPAMAATPSFSDIYDQETAMEVDVLRMLGVIDGTGAGRFDPGGTLTRAQFCKMAVVIMDEKDQEPLYRNRTIFSDVTSTHWARGYVNLAASTNVGGADDKAGAKLIRGTGSGRFDPDRAITFAEAVTILMRILGYTDADAGMLWPQGYLDLAGEIGLTEGVGLSALGSLTRAQAAHLFCNLLDTPQKDGSKYINTLGSKVTEDVVILALDVTADDGATGAIRTSLGDSPLLPAGDVVPQSFQGKRGTLVRDARDKILTFLPDGSENIPVVVTTCDAGWITGVDGTKYTIPTDATVYTADGTSSFDKEWFKLVAGSQVTLYTTGGKVSSLYIGSAAATQEAVVVMSDVATAGTFASITGGAYNYKIYKNGEAIDFNDIKKYDVATFADGVLTVCDQRLTGLYENASPNQTHPTKLTMFGQAFDVLDTAVASAAKHKVGDSITLLLTGDGKVAGVASPQDVRSNVVGVLNGGKVTVLGTNIALDCTNANQDKLNKLNGQLVTVSSYRSGNQLTSSVTALTSNGAPGAFDVKNMTLGSYPVTAGAAIYDRVGDGFVLRVQKSALTQASVPASKIVYYHLNSSKMVDAIVLDDATGDCYAYGYLQYTAGQSGDGMDSGTNATIKVVNSGRNKDVPTTQLETGYHFSSGSYGGVAANANGRVAGSVELTRVRDVTRAHFVTIDGRTYLNYGSLSIPVAERVECFNKPANTWFTGDDPLTEARAFSDNFTIYYDRTPDKGGKVRVIVAN